MEKILNKELAKGIDKNTVCLVDVRSEDEFKSGHIPEAICMPLETLLSKKELLPKDKTIILSCQSGFRANKAFEMLAAHGYKNVKLLEGGFSAWKSDGLPVNTLKSSIPIFRQVLIVAGLSVLTGSLLGMFVDSRFFWIPVFFGSGLSFAGISGWCGMAFILERMPWNRTQS